MKPIKKIIKILWAAVFVLGLPIQAKASGFALSTNTGDGGLIGIAIAVAACIVTAIVTMRLTKRKNKK
ncbi:MAG: hypothetical protein FWG34_10470 [Oscillospiraceae bacterium]|jgi:hypothetical protein|nr:hypothetical protein [Oscillospiraceae bacterium]